MSEAARTIAVTGGTGFVGRRFLGAAIDQGWSVRALTRRSQEPRDNITWVEGALDDADALHELCRGCAAVVHIAGVVNAPDWASFEAGNVRGTKTVASAAIAADCPRFLHISSLAATQPHLSDYGRSKQLAEQAVTDSALGWTIIRPPAIYGPGDTEMLEIFRMGKRGVVLLPPNADGRLSVIHVDDLTALMLAILAGDGLSGQIFECDDGRSHGWMQREFADAVGTAVGRKIRAIGLPKPVLQLCAVADRFIRGKSAKLTADRVNYFCHGDWTIADERRPPSQLWRPEVDTPQGLADTAKWYAQEGWL